MDINRLIYGTMGIDETEKGEKAIQTAINSGIRTFDFANIYQKGKSEKIFGAYLKKNKDLRKELFLQSKVGIQIHANPSKNKYNFSAEHIIKEVEGILDRLNTDYLDCLILHRFDPLMDPKELFEV